MNFDAVGKIVYNPIARKVEDPWWIIVKCPNDILDYYHEWIRRELHITLSKPLFGAHISIVKGEKLPYEHLWGEYQDQEVFFSYSMAIENAYNYYWLNIKCKELDKIRIELGLAPLVEINYHMSIGKEI